MKKEVSEFVRSLDDVFATFGSITVKRMFGGYGVYREGVMFALVADDVLYLKVDVESAPAFLAQGLTPFEYVKNGRSTKMSYYLAPEEIYEDSTQADAWAERAYAAALRAKRATNKPSPS